MQQSESCGYNFQLQRQLGAFISTHVDTDHINFQTNNNNSSEDLGLSLHCFQDHPGLIQWQSQQEGANQTPPSNEHQIQQTPFAGSTPVGFENHYQRSVTWNNEATTTDHVNRLGFLFNSQPYASAYAQSGGTLQSSFSFPMTSSSELHRPQPVNQPSSIFGSRFVSDGLAGFCIPDRIQGVEENHGVASNRPSSSPSSIH